MSFPKMEVAYLLSECARADTSVAPQMWNAENPLFGHCAAAALITQDFLGGKILSSYFPEEWKERLGSRSHYWNVLPGGEVVDFSKSQFPDDFPWDDLVSGRVGEFRGDDDKREYILKSDDTRLRWVKLRERIDAFVIRHPILTDKKLQLAWRIAFEEPSRCGKMRFACVVFDGAALVAKSSNAHMTEQFGRERFCSLDGSRCGRAGIPHRVDPTIGDCGHAPIWCLKKVWELGYRPRDLVKLNFYEGGFYPDGRLWQRKEPSYTCASCQNDFAIFGLDKIWGVYNMEWRAFLTKDSFYEAADYLTEKKKI